MGKEITIAFAGNPNSGKTTIFNRITGAHQHVGNYPGVTVDIKEGKRNIDGLPVKFIDLPGTYSLTALSEEELVSRNFIVESKPDVVIDVLDASTLERQLYLAVQLIELGVPLVLAFNMTDVAEKAGFKFDIPLLSDLLGIPIVQTTATSGKGLAELLQTALSVARQKIEHEPKPLVYGKELDTEIDRIVTRLSSTEVNPYIDLPLKWSAIKLLENDSEVVSDFMNTGGDVGELFDAVEGSRQRLARIYSDPADMLIAEARYGIISGAASEAVTRTVEERHNFSDRLDKVLINPFVGMPIFLVLMYLVFWLTFTIGDPLMGWLETGFAWLGGTVNGWFGEGSESPIRSLIVDGIIGGVGGVIVFLPNIMLLFISIAVLEDTGYMARAAFIMDRLMHKIGLHGKSFIPMLIGFGCSVPAIMGTRILENKRDRLVTILIIPLMSCGARLPIYALIIPAFFPSHLQGPMLWTIYVIGIILAVVLAKLLRTTIFKGESSPFVMELPPYRTPTIQGLLIHAWDRGRMYLKKAGTIILAISILLWWATAYPKLQIYSDDYDSQLETLRIDYETELMDVNLELGLPDGFDNIKIALDKWIEDDRSELTTTNSLLADRFLETVIEIDEIRIGFDRAVDEQGLIENTPDFITVKYVFESRLTELEESKPDYFPIAENYLDNILSPYLAQSSEIEFKIYEENLNYSIMGRFGRFLEPVFRPMGYDWKLVTATLGALAAKEVFVAQLGIVFSVGEADSASSSLRQKLMDNYSPLIGFCIMLFSLISAPCVATLVVTRSETRSWGWALFQFFGLTVLAWILTTLVYQVGTFFGIGV